MKAVQPIWHEFTAEFNFADGLDPQFAAYALTSETGSKHGQFTASGERWVAKLYSQDSNGDCNGHSAVTYSLALPVKC